MTHYFAAISYRAKLTWAIVLTSAIVVALTCLAFLIYEASTFRRSLAEEQLALAQFTAQNATAAVVFLDHAAAAENLAAFKLAPHVRHAAIFAAGDDEPLAHYHRKDIAGAGIPAPSAAARMRAVDPVSRYGGDHLIVTAPIKIDDELLGHLDLEIGLDKLRQTMLTYIGIGAMVFAVVLLIAFLIARVLSSLVSRPVERLSAAMIQVKNSKDYSRHVAKTHADEFGHLIDSFNAMLDEIAKRDIRMEQLVAQLIAARDEAQAASVAKSQFLANMSHELRTPLNAVIGYAEIVEEDLEDAGITAPAEDLRRIKSSANHLLSLINDILDLSKIEAGRMELDLHEFALAPLVEDVAATVEPIARQRGNTLSLNVKADAVLMSDSTKLKQVLLNLLSNASKFTDHGEICLMARVGRSRDGADIVEICVSDTGIGMSQDQIARLFQPFMQADASVTRKFGGTGLGLAITHRFISMLGGTIEVVSHPGAGSEFIVRIPRRMDTAGAGRSAEGLAMPLAEITADTGKRPLILVIDDKADARDLAERWLPRLGYDVVTAASMAEGFVAARHLQPAALILDMQMGGIDWRAALARLHSDVKTQSISVILCSGDAGAQAAIDQSRHGFLSKPLDRHRLGAKLAACTQQPSGRVLLVEDDAEFASRLGADLKDAGFGFLHAANAAQALLMLDREAVDAIVIDLKLPDMAGSLLIERLRHDPAMQAIPRIVLSAMDIDRATRAALMDKTAAIIAKGPHGALHLFDVLRSVLRAGPVPEAAQSRARA